MSTTDDQTGELEQRLKRLTDALSHASGSVPTAEPEDLAELKKVARVGLAASLALIAVAIAMGDYGLIALGITILVASGLGLSTRVLRALTPEPDPRRPQIGQGANVAKDAVVEPGAVVGAGAKVKRGAIIRKGAIIRSGSNIGEGAVIEERALISWGVNVGDRAVVGAGAVISTGTNIGKGARVPPGMRLYHGTNWKSGDPTPVSPATPVVDKDPRSDRIDALCTRLQTELFKSSEAVRAFLGPSHGTVTELRRAFHALLQRERALRLEAEPESLPALEKERAALALKIDAASDPDVRRSLESAIAAINEQRRQRELMARQADRVEAEVTRLLWTLDAMGAQLARARTAGAELSAADQGLGRSVKQLHNEISAIADALDDIAAEERVALPDSRIAPLEELSSREGTSAVVRDRTRS